MKRRGNLKKSNNKEKKTDFSILQFLKPRKSEINDEDSISKTDNISSDNDCVISINSISEKTNYLKCKNLQNIVNPNIQKIYKESNENYKKKIIINNHFTKEISDNFIPIKENIEKFLIQFNKKYENKLYNKRNFKSVFENIELFVIKFFLQIEDTFIYVPNFLSNSKMENLKEINEEKHLFKLFEGFDPSSNFLTYQPISSKEIINDNLVNELLKYLKRFSAKKPKNKKNNNKAFVLYDDKDYLASEKLIEAICNDLDFQILKIDDLESKKVLRFNKISEATQSKRITSVPDSINNKIEILEKILNNNSSKFCNFFENETVKNSEMLNKKEIKKSIDKTSANLSNNITISNLNNNQNASKEITDFYNSFIKKEKEIFYTIKHNMMKFVNNKKTLILISDTFSNTEEAKSYITSITGKINETKTPIVILTNNINFTQTENKNINKYLITHLNDKSENFKQKLLFQIIIIYILHFIFLPIFFDYLKDLDFNKEDNIEFLKLKIKEEFETLNKMLTKEAYKIIFDSSLKICLIKKYNQESIFYFMKQAEKKLRKIEKESVYDIIKENEKIISNLLNEELMSLEINNNFKSKSEFSFENFNIDSNESNKKSKIIILDESDDEEVGLNKEINLREKNELKMVSKRSNLYSFLDMEQGKIVNL